MVLATSYRNIREKMKIVQENTGRKETEFDPEKREQETAGKISVRKKLYKNSRTDRKNKSVRL